MTASFRVAAVVGLALLALPKMLELETGAATSALYVSRSQVHARGAKHGLAWRPADETVSLATRSGGQRHG